MYQKYFHRAHDRASRMLRKRDVYIWIERDAHGSIKSRLNGAIFIFDLI